MQVTAYQIATRFIGVKETAGATSNPSVLAMLRLDAAWVEDDVTPWCSSFANWVCWLLELPRSKSLAARSWLNVGQSIPLSDAKVGFDVVILKRGDGPQPGPEVISASGHVGFYAGVDAEHVLVLGGNQGDAVNVAKFPKSRILGVRRLIS